MTSATCRISEACTFSDPQLQAEFVHFKNRFIDLIDSKTRLAAKCGGAVLAWGEIAAPKFLDRPFFIYTKNLCDAANLGLAPRDLIKSIDKIGCALLNPTSSILSSNERKADIYKDVLKGAKALKDTLRGYSRYTQRLAPPCIRYLDLFCAAGNLVQDLHDNKIFRPMAVYREIQEYEGNKYKKITYIVLTVIAESSGTTGDAISLANLILFRTFCPHLSLFLGAVSLTATVMLHFLEEPQPKDNKVKAG